MTQCFNERASDAQRLNHNTTAVDDGRTIGFGRNPLADLSDLDQRMEFVLFRGAASLFFSDARNGGCRAEARCCMVAVEPLNPSLKGYRHAGLEESRGQRA
ncbi:hypothetical protein [Pseudomonas sp. NPDC089534]|uniref:hypothetical protein n=1 Tax=Pseudomonas sp. NPDC089534 TaxID=3364468 RepID=UPI00383066A1